MPFPPELQKAFLILVLSIISLLIGNSVVLFANRVSHTQFIRSLLAFTFLFLLSFLFWVFSVQVLADLLFGVRKPFVDVFVIVSHSFTPFLLGFLILLPHLGHYLYALLRVWVVINLIINVAQVYEVGLLQALAVSMLGWVLLELITSLSFLQLDAIKRWFLKITTGKAEYRDPNDLVMEYVRAQRLLMLQAARKEQEHDA
jgi:signal transduction histidine kinase